MPPTKVQRTEKEQADQFQKEAQKLINAGDLDPTAADVALHTLVKRRATKT
jgi:hypothetical protein